MKSNLFEVFGNIQFIATMPMSYPLQSESVHNGYTESQKILCFINADYIRIILDDTVLRQFMI